MTQQAPKTLKIDFLTSVDQGKAESFFKELAQNDNIPALSPLGEENQGYSATFNDRAQNILLLNNLENLNKHSKGLWSSETQYNKPEDMRSMIVLDSRDI